MTLHECQYIWKITSKSGVCSKLCSVWQHNKYQLANIRLGSKVTPGTAVPSVVNSTELQSKSGESFTHTFRCLSSLISVRVHLHDAFYQSALFAFCAGNHGDSPHKGQVMRDTVSFLVLCFESAMSVHISSYTSHEVDINRIAAQVTPNAAVSATITFGHMMMSSNGNIFSVTGPLCGEFTGPGEFPTQRPVTRSFVVFFDLRLDKRLSEQPWSRLVIWDAIVLIMTSM